MQIWKFEELRRQRAPSLLAANQTFQEQLDNYRREQTIATLREDQKRRVGHLQQLSNEEFLRHKPLPVKADHGKRARSAEDPVGYQCLHCTERPYGYRASQDFNTNPLQYVDHDVQGLTETLGGVYIDASVKKLCQRGSVRG